MPSHVLTIGSDTSIQVEENDTVLRAALRAGLGFPYECNSGGCGGCHFQLLEGEVRDRWPEAPGLSEQARSAGRHLACQSEITGNCNIKVRLKPAFQPAILPAQTKARLVAKRAITSDMAEYSFQTKGPAGFIPGQYAMLKIPGVDSERAYSMANLPNPEGIWNFVIKEVPGGAASTSLAHDLQIDDIIDLDGPFGMAYFKAESPRDIVCIAGGSGLSPILSILRAALQDPESRDKKIHFFYGARTVEGLCLEYLRNSDLQIDDRVTFTPVLSEAAPDDQWPGAISYVHEAVKGWLGEIEDPKAFEYYLCGPPLMADAVQNLLILDHALPSSQLHYDRFA